MMWACMINAVLGIWLMVAPAVLRYGDPAATNDRIVGPIVASIATIAISESTRPVRWVNFPLGLWLMLAPGILGYDQLSAWINSLVVGTVLALLTPVHGPLKHRLGGGWRALWQARDEHHTPGSGTTSE